MFGRMRQMFSRPSVDYDSEEYADRFAKAKEASLREVLGRPHDHVLHALIPYAMGGALDLYPFPEPGGGTLYVTQEVIEPTPSGGPKRGKIGRYELAACSRIPFAPGRPQPGPGQEGDPDGTRLISRMLNPIARYSGMAVLNPLETLEIPGDAEDGSDSLHVVLDKLSFRGKTFSILGERCGLLLCIAIHQAESHFARTQGSDALLEQLKRAGVYPYSDLNRDAVA